MEKLNKGDILYWARIIPETGIYEVNELKVRTIEDTYFVGTEHRTKQAFLFAYFAIDNIIFADRNKALKMAQDAEKNKKTFDEIEYEEY